MAVHVTLKSQAQAPLVRSVVDVSADLSAKELRAPSLAALRTIMERLLERMPSAKDPLAKARLRGVFAQRELLDAEGGTLSAAEIAKALGVTRQAIDKRRKAGQLLALEVGKRGYLYPAWQLAEPGLLPGLAQVLSSLPADSPWATARFFLSGNDRLRGRRPLDVLRKGDVDVVVRAAAAFGEQGAA
jgi:biotin operon repressor